MSTNKQIGDIIGESTNVNSESTIKSTPPERQPPAKKWYIITNQRNLFRLLSTGLLAYPETLTKGYLDDFFSDFPGYVFIFADKIPKTAFDRILSVKPNLVPVIIQYDISRIIGNVIAVTDKDTKEEIELPSELDGHHRALLIPAPLPTTAIQSIYFEDKKKRENFIDRASGKSNVPFDHWPNSLSKTLFKPNKVNMDINIGRPDISNQVFTKHLTRVLINAGIRTLHFQLANLDPLANNFYQWAYHIDTQPNPKFEQSVEEILRPLPEWIATGHVDLNNIKVSSSRLVVELFWKLIERMVVPLSDDLTEYDLVISVLTDEAEQRNSATNLSRLIDELRELRSGLPSESVDELFNRHKSPFTRALILFFIRDNCRDLLTTDIPGLTTVDRLVASILFATRELWHTYALDLRGVEQFSKMISLSMAQQFQKMRRSGLEMDVSIQQVEPIYELLLGDKAAQSSAKKYRDARVAFAKHMDWECIQSTLTLPNGNYTLQGSSTGIKIVLSGEMKSITTDVETKLFKENLLALNKIDLELEHQIRKILG